MSAAADRDRTSKSGAERLGDAFRCARASERASTRACAHCNYIAQRAHERAAHSRMASAQLSTCAQRRDRRRNLANEQSARRKCCTRDEPDGINSESLQFASPSVATPILRPSVNSRVYIPIYADINGRAPYTIFNSPLHIIHHRASMYIGHTYVRMAEISII